MHVYLLIHDDRFMDDGEYLIRGVYATRELAEADVNAKRTRYAVHDKGCCRVEPWHVMDGADAALISR